MKYKRRKKKSLIPSSVKTRDVIHEAPVVLQVFIYLPIAGVGA